MTHVHFKWARKKKNSRNILSFSTFNLLYNLWFISFDLEKFLTEHILKKEFLGLQLHIYMAIGGVILSIKGLILKIK